MVVALTCTGQSVSARCPPGMACTPAWILHFIRIHARCACAGACNITQSCCVEHKNLHTFNIRACACAGAQTQRRSMIECGCTHACMRYATSMHVPANVCKRHCVQGHAAHQQSVKSLCVLYTFRCPTHRPGLSHLLRSSACGRRVRSCAGAQRH